MVKRKNKKKAQLPFRLNILFFVVFLSFSVLILQLGVVQILNGESFQEEIERTIEDTSKVPVPRGKIYDSNHDVVVDNKPLYSITYTPAKGVQAEDRLEVAERLAEFISMDTDGITERNRKEYWYLKNKDEAESRVSDEEAEEMSNSEYYDMVLDRISEEEISNFSEEEEEVIAIKKELDKARSLTPHIVKNEDVTPEEYARVAEHLDVLPGVNATTDWNREYPYDDTIRNLLGSITTQEEGIPSDQEEYYLTRGYSRNDRVGNTGLEEQYEGVLRGTKEQIQYSTDKSGNVVNTETVVEGERGKDLVLTIDMEFQERVDEIVREELDKAISEAPYENRNMEDALAVVMDPQTGELLAVSGQTYDREEDEFNNTAYKTLYDAHIPGSIVKGATMLAGYESEVVTPGQTFYDAPIKIAGTEEKASWRNLGLVNDLDALQQSSNIYMFHIAMRMGGEYNYQRNESVSFDPSAWQEMRNYFRQFGLGSETGVDYPFESTGYEGSQGTAGNFMDHAIGQFDTYTTMQMAQYVSTIANDGYRVRPHFLKEIRNPVASEENLGSVYKHHNTDVLNRIQMDQDHIERVQEGFRQVFQTSDGTGYSYFGDKDYNPAGKTGTAENELYEDGSLEQYTENLSLVGYAPFDEPEIAFAVVVPHTGEASGINHYIGEGILDAYFDLKEDRSEGNEDNEGEENEE
ncbi:penicillin-binding protein 2 [Virgibacillus sp. NKC19-16]|uniref:peptidoglycan D,D-transpeptidase FtsI family protein n=1 Tax=Virgibacillus salidurans TaxID=2831673 RepID=UPI001F256593|nr:penicillin-binding protein 2 [Virgibacillus sp. NKC19-16]UJL44854.1 penicillin-binding protein 2 [Virgibacillus sp. NKC19-16]